MKIATICGSTRDSSSNASLLEAYRKIAIQSGIQSEAIYLLSRLPHFDPNATDESLPTPVVEFRQSVSVSDVIVFSTPEYIHAMPAILKNCLEWLVGDPSFCGKPVVVLQTKVVSNFANDSLIEVLTTMAANILQDACVGLSIQSNKVNCEDILRDTEWTGILERSVSSITETLRSASS